MTRIIHPHINRAKVLGSLVPVLEEYRAPSNIHDITSDCRSAELVYARALIVFILRQRGFTFTQIGYVLNRDHATAIYMLSYGTQHPENLMYQRATRELKDFSLTETGIKIEIEYHEERIQYHQSMIEKLSPRCPESLVKSARA